jgi:AbrB family looped-hinge helix DNA binding protein
VPATLEIKTFHGTVDGMKITIDNAGRIVVPKALRDALHLSGGDEVEIELDGERLTLTPAPRKVKLRRGPHGILTSDLQLNRPISAEEVREELERTRR